MAITLLLFISAAFAPQYDIIPLEAKEPANDDNKTIETAKEAAKKANIEVKISSFHAGAETHIYANKKNKNNVTFRPVLVGIADIYGMHSSDEKMNIESFKKGYNFIEEFFIEYNK